MHFLKHLCHYFLLMLSIYLNQACVFYQNQLNCNVQLSYLISLHSLDQSHKFGLNDVLLNDNLVQYFSKMIYKL